MPQSIDQPATYYDGIREQAQATSERRLMIIIGLSALAASTLLAVSIFW